MQPCHQRLAELRTEEMGKADTAGGGRPSHAPSGAGATRLALMPPSAGGKAGRWASFLRYRRGGAQGRLQVLGQGGEVQLDTGSSIQGQQGSDAVPLPPRRHIN